MADCHGDHSVPISDLPVIENSSFSSALNKACCHKTDGTSRNLIVCIDGTANQFGAKNTNVIELYNLILKGVKGNQRTWYNSGIGTYVRPSRTSFKFYQQFIYHTIDLAIAWDFKRTILAAYRWLSDNYEPGDCIFLFGFSRGAFQVRVLSAMIDKVGLIYKGNEMQIPFAYQLYADPKSDERTATEVGSPDPQQNMSSAARFKKAFSYEDVTVHFVGAWDTVSSIGIARGKAMLPRTVEGMKHVCYFRHALALDERRVKFLPEYAYGGSTKPPATTQNDTSASDSPPGNSTIQGSLRSDGGKSVPRILEVWFPGTHSDIGGGNADNIGMNRSRPPLRWMVFEAGALGLRTAVFDRELKLSEQIDFKESLTLPWWPLELLFFRRLTYTRKKQGKTTTYKPHLGSSRKIHDGQKIHSSIILTNAIGYTPKARPLNDDPAFWEKVRTKEFFEWLERDLYSYAEDLVKQFIVEKNDVLLETLRQIAISADGRQAVCKSLYPGVIAALGDHALSTERKNQLLLDTMDILRSSSRELKLIYSTKIRTLIMSQQASSLTSIHSVTAKQFVAQCTDSCIMTLRGHSGFVCSVAFSPDGKNIASGSNDHTVRIWDVETGTPVKEMAGGHKGSVTAVAYSRNGKQVVSGSSDKTLRIWDTSTGNPVGDPFKGHSDSVSSVAASPDGDHIVSGSDDLTVRIWSSNSGGIIGDPLPRLTGRVWSVAFSPNGAQIASGLSDHTVRIWDTQTRKAVARPLEGHTGSVRSVAFSSDGNYVASASTDRTVRVWDVRKGEMVGKPLQGHTGWVSSVAFSRDGKRLVSGSSDFTARIWDVKSGITVGVLVGHEGAVTSVMFSPDGRLVASGSSDKTVRIWDVESE